MENENNQRKGLKEKQSEQLLKVMRILAKNGNFIDSPGLGDGKMGLAILFYNFYRIFSLAEYEEYASSLIDDIYTEINNETTLDLKKGLTGIGWGIEYLSKNGFIEGNTDEILDEIDKTVYSRLASLDYSSDNVLSAESGYDYYLNARRRDTKLKMEDLDCFIKPLIKCEEIFNVKLLVDSRNYGLFEGLAGIGLMTLEKLSRRD